MGSFVPATSQWATALVKHAEVVDSRGGYSIMKSGSQAWLQDSKGEMVAGPVAAPNGIFILYGKLKDLTGIGGVGGSGEFPGGASGIHHTEDGILRECGPGCSTHPGRVKPEKTEAEKEREAKESLDAKVSGRRK